MGVNETIGRINIKIGHFNEAIQSEELDSNNETYKCRDKYKQILSAHDINGEEKTLSTSKKKENVRDGYVRIYECGKLFFIKTLKRACEAQKTTINKMWEVLGMWESWI